MVVVFLLLINCEIQLFYLIIEFVYQGIMFFIGNHVVPLTLHVGVSELLLYFHLGWFIR